ncbi:CinA family protein [Gluconacetobacter tumulisoli]|uniref:Nicotinamide-nucleotide amidohydrolase family protein n=1 Tax=Gluconacetobacter tumulisoli TaxID=1286189 RepID=A0A7W4PPC3_9PROT|nr:nicotinamide-nucleotide amidohydrolase family protein [Gluconacetobacter tumulisoli]MBB2201671.1 nicotinamide-nucleotide amidohydrolase family protein [Gluconacetobacter tumulisoli]
MPPFLLDNVTLDQAGRLLAVLRGAGLRVATAESCTGGLVAASLTHHAGSSDVVEGGFVTYSNGMKTTLLGVDPGLLARHGAVSAETAAAMADGALVRVPATDITVSITGIAGPGGGSAAKPVGLVWFATARRNGATVTLSRVFDGDRASVRQQAVAQALDLIGQRVHSS